MEDSWLKPITNESDKQDWNILQKTFEQNIMYSPSLGDDLSKEDFKILINNFLNTEEYQGKKGISQTNQNLHKLIGKFKNPLPIIKEIIFETQAELEATSYIVEQIIKDNSIIKSEEDTDKISNIAKDFKRKITTQKETIQMSEKNLDQILDEIVQNNRAIEAIVLVNLNDSIGEYYNRELKSTNPELFESLFGDGGVAAALEDFDAKGFE